MWFLAPAATILVMLAGHLNQLVWDETSELVHASRNFYGVLRVSLEEDLFGSYYSLSHGQIEHGVQYVDEFLRHEPMTYYGTDSGLGMAIGFHPRRTSLDEPTPGLRVGVVGLGTGTIAAYGLAGDQFCFYEIDRDVVELSNSYFSYLKDSSAETEVVIGDARIAMERELARTGSRQFDVLAVDAFSGDAIPVHLLTLECGDIYRQHLKPDGVLAIHISNRYLDLEPVVRALAQHLRWPALCVDTDDDEVTGTYGSTWIVITNNRQVASRIEAEAADSLWVEDDPEILQWTDDFASLWQVIDL
jgi:spermidine synthase